MTYTFKYEEYHNDYTRRMHEISFTTLDSATNWIFNQIQHKWTEGMYFPCREPSRIEFQPVFGGPSYWIYMITSDRGIEFSDGRFTSGQKHWSKDIQNWLSSCREKQKAPKFTFAE